MDGVFNNFLNQTWNEKYNNNNNSSTSSNIAANGKTSDNNGNNNEKGSGGHPLTNNSRNNNNNNGGGGTGQLSLSDIMESNMMRQQLQQFSQNLSFFNNNNNGPSTSNASSTPLSASIDFRDLRPTAVPTNQNSFKSPSETPAQHLARLGVTKQNNNPFNTQTNTNHDHYRNSFTNNSIPFAAMCNAMVANAGANAQNSGGHIASQADSTSPPPSQSAAVSLLALQASGGAAGGLNGNGLLGATQLGSLMGVGTANGGEMDKKTPNSIRGKKQQGQNEFLINKMLRYKQKDYRSTGTFEISGSGQWCISGRCLRCGFL